MKRLLLIFCLLLSFGLSYGQKIEDVDFTYRDGKVYITYDADLEKGYRLENVRAYVSINGDSYKPLTAVSGAVGLVTKAGVNTIIWDPFAEFGYETISGEVRFKIQGEGKHKFAANWRDVQKRYGYAEYIATVDAPIGFTMGFGKRVGGYWRIRVSSDTVWQDDKEHNARVATTFGVYYRITKWFRINAGLGYGDKFYQSYENGFGNNSLCKLSGMEYEADITINVLKWLGITVGYCDILASNKSDHAPFTGQVQFGVSFNF